MRNALIVLMLAAVAVTGCGLDLTGLLGASCANYDALGNGDGIVTEDEVRAGLDLVFGEGASASFSDADIQEFLNMCNQGQ